MKRTLTWSDDGSPTLYSETFGETYHSDAGAVEESLHVFLRAGLKHRLSTLMKPDTTGKRSLHLVEYGFGMGFNVLLTLEQHQQWRQQGVASPDIYFRTLEKFPLTADEYSCLRFPQSALLTDPEMLLKLHQAPWEQPVEIVPGFFLLKQRLDFTQATATDLTTSPSSTSHPAIQGFCQPLDLIYFDAFSPGSQPELWEFPIFQTLAKASTTGCVLVTYSARGSVKQALRDAGLTVKRLPGYGRKRHMLRATFLPLENYL